VPVDPVYRHGTVEGGTHVAVYDNLQQFVTGRLGDVVSG
jgi:hypothetical protein